MAAPLLADLPGEELQRLQAAARRRTFGRNEVVFHQGDPADSMHMIQKGRFAVRVRTPIGDVATIAILGAGDAFGELALIGEEHDRSATVLSLEPSETLSISRGDLDRVRHEQPQVNELLVRLLAARLRRTNALLAEALYVTADRRVVHRLRELAQLYANPDGETRIPLTQEEIATLAGTSRATVNRVLRAEERSGALELTRGHTIIRDVDRLGKAARSR
jgi:CRP/FNR family cyclic AMP-dependent transcriptional regulator